MLTRSPGYLVVLLYLTLASALPATVRAALDPPESPATVPVADGVHVLDGSCVLNVGNLRVNITNHGLIGSQYSSAHPYSHAPSGEWPGGSGDEYLWGAGLWIGARIGGVVSVTTGQPEREMRPSAELYDTIYEAKNGVQLRPDEQARPTGIRLPAPGADDDADGRNDEDPLNGVDDDQDGRVDEDFGQLGDQMFACTMYDNTNLVQSIYPEHRPLGVRIYQQATTWDQDVESNVIGLDYTITNIGHNDLHEVYLGFYVDCDIQSRTAGSATPDDLAGSFSGVARAGNGHFYRLEVGYMWDGAREDPLPGYFGVVLGDHETSFNGSIAPRYPQVRAFEIFAARASVAQQGEPLNDQDRYALMARAHRDRNRRDDEPNDYKFLMTSGPFGPFEIGDEMQYQVALVAGRGLSGMLANAVEARRIADGEYVNRDNDWVTGSGGRETFVCIGDYPRSLWGKDPILGHRYDWMDETCTGNLGVIGFSVIIEEDLIQYPDGRLCTWVNMDNCTECLRYWGRECNRSMYFSHRGRLTGTWGRETQYHWSLDAPRPLTVPRARVQPGDRQVEVFWDDLSQYDTDPDLGIPDFEAYRIWRVSDWVPPGDVSADAYPPASAWGMIAQFDLVNEVPAGVGGIATTRQLGPNTGLEICSYEPDCLDDARFDGLAEAMQTLVDSDPTGRWYSRPPVRQPDGSIPEYMRPLARWESYPDVLDTFYAVTERVADASAGIVAKPATRYYHYIDTDQHNGFQSFYAVVAQDHDLVSLDGALVPAGPGIEADPSSCAMRTMARTDAQTVQERDLRGANIYVSPNPATREALEEFQARSPSAADPTGARVMFNNLPLARNTIRIFTLAGDLIQTIPHDGAVEGGAAFWNLMSRSGQEVVSGVYLFSVHSDEQGFEPFRGKFVVIR